MNIGAVFPQTEIGEDPSAVRDYAQAVEAMGFDHLLAFDHVVGANAATHDRLSGPYRHTHAFHEPLVLFGYLAGITRRIELVTGIIILPQRQTVLVAKQTAAVDVLSGGRLRLGIGIGWNDVEYEALGENFSNRGRRSEEQVEVLRALWTNELVTYEGRWHKISDAGINPLPVQRPIPVWFGGRAEQVIERVGRMGDGWFPLGSPADAAPLLDKMRQHARDAGRDPASIGVESWISIGGKTPDDWVKDAVTWKELGATHLSVNTMNAGLKSPQDHIDAVQRFKEAVEGI
ncbi:MAG: LLM class F420-dependent oxidoreductase [Chloroflexi bacterium]|nr:LLM class F420-dependent oxidoreductase [Chloroflexota bacterium]